MTNSTSKPYPINSLLSLLIPFGLCLLFYFIQTPTMQAQGWSKTYNSDHDGGALDLLQTPDGGYLLAGYSSNDSLYGEHTLGTLLKTDADGSMQWETNFGDGRYTVFNDVIHSSDGNYVATGSIGYSSDVLGTFDSLTIPYYGQGYIVKADVNGDLIWSAEIGTMNWNEALYGITETSDGGYMVSGRSHDIAFNASIFPYFGYNVGVAEGSAVLLAKYDQGGTLLWSDTLDVGEKQRAQSIHATDDGGALVWVSGIDNTNSKIALLKIRADGVMEWQRQYDPTTVEGFIFGWKQVALADGTFVLSANTTPSGSADQPFLMKVDTLGTILWEKTYSGFLGSSVFGLTQLSDGGFVMAGVEPNTFTEYPLFWLKADADGNEVYRHLWDNQQGNYLDVATAVVETPSGGLAIAGATTIGADNILFINYEMLLLTTFENGSFYENKIVGKVFFDEAEDCLENQNDYGLENWLVIATDSLGGQHYGTTDEGGNYIINLNSGTYEVTAVKPSYLFESCASLETQTIVVGGINSPAAIADFPHFYIAYCPILTIDWSSTGLRRCFDNNYYVHYCNNGTTGATDAYVEIVLDEYLTLNDASIPFTSQGDTLYIFEVGDIPMGDCGTFSLDVYVDCDSTVLGQIHCSEAHIYPDSLCIDPEPTWDLSSVSTSGFCSNDSIHFTISNEGLGNMSEQLDYFIVVDEVIMLQGDFQLGSGEDTTIVIAATLQFYRIEADQSTGHPGANMPSAEVFGCPDFTNGNFVNWFAQNDQDYFIDIDCRANIGSYDPNEKLASPIGYGDEHFIEEDTRLEYQINFQNTGTDTAFLVTLRDTLSPHLDISTLEIGASSHIYRWELSSSGTLKFIFENILLPDSTTNEEASHGFVKYKISPKENSPIGSIIENSAAIYFDFNEPVITNTVFHTIGEDFIPIEIFIDVSELEKEKMLLKAFPNPSNEGVHFELPFEPSAGTYFMLYDNLGKQIRVLPFENQHFYLERRSLVAGMYSFVIQHGGGLLYSGKVVLY